LKTIYDVDGRTGPRGDPEPQPDGGCKVTGMPVRVVLA
jgi:hypothetical protein